MGARRHELPRPARTGAAEAAEEATALRPHARHLGTRRQFGRVFFPGKARRSLVLATAEVVSQ
jgi:hypothetical protein